MMAEVTIDAQVNIETDEENDCQLRRSSYRDTDCQNRVPKWGSRYRSPLSPGSCHDLCKHGVKSDPETLDRRSLVRKNSLDSPKKSPRTREVIKKELPESPRKVSSSLRRQASSPSMIKYASQKQERVSKPKTPPLAATRQLHRRNSDIIITKNSAGGSSGQTNREKKVNKETENSKIEKTKILARDRFSLSSMSSAKRFISAQSENVKKMTKVPSTLKNRKQIKVDGKCPPSKHVIEKTPYVIRPKAGNQAAGLAKRGSFTSLQSSPEKGLSSLKSQTSASSSPEAMQSDSTAFDIDNSESEYSVSDLEVEDSRIPSFQVRRLEDEDWPSSQKLKFRRGKVIDLKLEDFSQKLRFRRGNVVDVQPEDLSPSVLKFRHQEALEENQNSDNEGISLTKISSDEVLYETNAETEKVTLKHQDAETKGETWGFIDDAIEETANRLAQSRKSKVKALVGAFEAVLGRQDSPRR